MAGQDGQGQDLTEGEGTRERVSDQTAQLSERPLQQVSGHLIMDMLSHTFPSHLSAVGPRSVFILCFIVCVCVCWCRLEQEKAALQRKLKARGVTADQVVGVRSNEMEKEVEELKKKNFDLEKQILIIKYSSTSLFPHSISDVMSEIC